MKKLLLALLALLLAVGLLAPGAAALIDGADEGYYGRFRSQNITIYVYNWGEYISDGSDDSMNVNKEFEELTGIKVNYSTFASNEELYAKLDGGGAQYDVIIPSDYMIARMIEENMLEPLNYANIPNFALVDDAYKGLAHDPTDEYSVPYMWGMTGLIYNTAMTDEEIDSWSALWDERYIGDILMFDNPRDAFGIALSMLGYSMNTTDPKELEEAADLLKEQKMLVQAYVMDQIFDKMEGAEAVVAPYYAGDAITMMEENPDLAFVFPKEGTNLFVDSFVIPKGAPNKEAAEMYINFMCEPEVSAANCEYIGYSTTIPEARDLLDLDEETMAIAYPSDEVLENSEVFGLLPADTNTLMSDLWINIKSYNENPNEWIGPVFLVVAVVLSIALNIYHARKRRKPIV